MFGSRKEAIKGQVRNRVTRPAGGVKPRPIGPARTSRVNRPPKRRYPIGIGGAMLRPQRPSLRPISKIKQVERASSRSGMTAQMDRLRSKRPF